MTVKYLKEPQSGIPSVLLEGYFLLDGDKRELIWFGDVERYVSMEQVAMAHIAARANKSTVIEWYYEGISPLMSECAPIKRQFDGHVGYRDDAEIAHTGCCDIRFVQRLAPNKELLLQIFDLVSNGIVDAEARARARTLFQIGAPLNREACSQIGQGFKATFWDTGFIELDEEAQRFGFADLISNADVYDAKPNWNVESTGSPSV